METLKNEIGIVYNENYCKIPTHIRIKDNSNDLNRQINQILVREGNEGVENIIFSFKM